MSRLRVLPYKQGSKSAKELATALNCKRLKVSGSSFNTKEGDTVINWGYSGEHRALVGSTNLFNMPEAVRIASNKHLFFERVGMDAPGVTPEFWTDAQSIPETAYPIVCRTILNGHSGQGIVIANNKDELVSAPLYVQYESKKDEYRVHVGRRSADAKEFILIATQRKARKLDVPGEKVNWKIRNHDNGFVFVRNNVNPPFAVYEAACKALDSVGLHFGAADVVFNEKKNTAFVLEVNTAPGLEGSTVDDYVNYFEEVMK